MFKHLNKLIRSNKLQTIPKTGQVAIILLIIIAIALIFFAVTFNLRTVTQTKILTTMSANVAAAQLGSLVASYGQALWQIKIAQGHKNLTENCKKTSVLGAILKTVAMVILVILSFIPGFQAFTIPLLIALAASMVSVGIEAAYIAPMMSKMINRYLTQNISETVDQFGEQAVQTALRQAANDTVLVPDAFDGDMDGVWGYDDNGVARDRVSRFGFYALYRIQKLEGFTTLPIETFTAALSHFLYAGSDDWGLTDPIPYCSDDPAHPCCQEPKPSECNFCCEPPESRDPCCDNSDPDEYCGTASTCYEQSPYQELDREPSAIYKYVFEPFIDNRYNTFKSFRELLGRDDVHRRYEKDSNNLYGVQTFLSSAEEQDFHVQDATGFYSADTAGGIFPMFYKLADWGTDLASLNFTDNSEHCLWCTEDAPECAGQQLPDEVKQDIGYLKLPIPPEDLEDTSSCVGKNVDKVYLPAGIIADPDDCAQHALDTGKGFWKRGDDRFCSPGDESADNNSGAQYPYDEKCDKYGDDPGNPAQCADGSSASLWPDDVLDDFLHGLVAFLYSANATLRTDAGSLFQIFPSWYKDYVAPWIEKSGDCYECKGEGYLWIWYGEIKQIKERMIAFREKTSFAGASCDDVWCVPPEGCEGISEEEEATFDSNNDGQGNGIRGDLEDVVKCLEWNISDPVMQQAGPVPYILGKGNADKFTYCGNFCTSQFCSDLPRSTLSSYDPQAYTPGNPNDEDDIQTFLNCFDNCSQSSCDRSTFPDMTAAGTTYTYPLSPFSETADCGSDGKLKKGTQWYNSIVNNLVIAGPSCNLNEGGWLDLTRQSAQEAKNQVAKLKHRYDFLKGRLDELNNAIEILNTAETKFKEFLDGPASAFIEARKNYDNYEHIRPYAVYGWQDPPGEGAEDNTGLWHIVRVDVRLPTRCDGYCGDKQDGSDEPATLPTITSEPSGFLNKDICYYMDPDTVRGVVKARVSRYDQDKAKEVSFPGGTPLWSSKMYHPDRGPYIAEDLSKTVYNACQGQMYTALTESEPNLYKGAFLLNEETEDNKYCWNFAHALLSKGVTSETCSEYYWHEGDNKGFSLKFVPCKNFLGDGPAVWVPAESTGNINPTEGGGSNSGGAGEPS